MPSQQAIVHQIRERVQQLAQAAAAAEAWRDRWLRQVDGQRQQRIDAAEAVKLEALARADLLHDQQVQQGVQRHQQRVALNEQQRDQALAAAQAAYAAGLAAVGAQSTAVQEAGGLLIAPWQDERWAGWTAAASSSDARAADPARVLRAGRLVESLRWHKLTLPALLPFFGSRGLLLKATGAARDPAAQALQSALLRLLASVAPGKLHFTFVDPIGLGQNAAPFMHLADYNEALVTGKAWTEPHHIEQRLADLTEQMENVIQKYLRNQFASIEDYNAKAGEVAEPYRVLVVFDFPANFSEAAARRLVSIAQNGPRCGVYTVVLADTAKPAPHGFSLSDLEQASTVVAWSGERFVWQDPDFKNCLLELDAPPPAEQFNRIVNGVGAMAKEAGKVEVPFERMFEIFARQVEQFRKDYPGIQAPAMPERPSTWQQASTAAHLVAPLGPSGAKKVQCLDLGKGTAHHALLVGQVGSGKSTLLHTLITSAALFYSPDELEIYLIDFKQGAEFKIYALRQLPQARVIAIDSEREFGLSVIQSLEREMNERGARLRAATQRLGTKIENLSDLRRSTGETMPRILLLVDEFQVFFADDDPISSQAARTLDSLVRQGRYVGIHLLLSSQTLAGAASLARSTIGQMAVRIALQCSEADSRLILAEDNPAARLLTRPGEAIYNAANGLVEGNNRFQVAWLSDEQRDHYLEQISALAAARNYLPPNPPIVFEGNTPAEVEKNQPLRALLASDAWPASARRVEAWLGDPVAIKEPAAARFRRQSASNLLIVGQQEEQALGMAATALASLAAQHPAHGPGAARFYILDFTPSDAPYAGLLARLAEGLPHATLCGGRRLLTAAMDALSAEVAGRLEGEGEELADRPSLYLAIFGLQRARDLRPDDSLGYSFAMPGDEPAPPNPAQQFATIVRDGPEVGVHSLICCDTYGNLGRVLDRRALREFDQRVAFQMSAEDSSNLVDTPAASKLGLFRALFYSEEDGRLEKFRPYGLPSEAWLSWSLERLQARA